MNAAEQNVGKFQFHLPLVSKIRGKQKSRLDKEECTPLTMAIDEIYSKGSLLDRIASLEDRIVQLCLEIESYKKSSEGLSTDKSSGASASSSSGSKTERICSYPTFDIPNPQSKRLPRVVINNNVEFQENTNRQQEQQIKISSSSTKKQHRGKKRDRKTGRKNGKNIGRSSWPHLKILGC